MPGKRKSKAQGILLQNRWCRADMMVLWLIIYIGKSSASSVRKELFPPDYNKNVPPKEAKPLSVSLSLDVMDVHNIDETNMVFLIEAYMREMWKDSRLNLEPFVNDSLSLLFEFRRDIWQPDLVFDNAKGGELFSLSVPNTGLRVLPNGYLLKTSRYNLKIGCKMNLRYYPVDTQHCCMKIASFRYTESVLHLMWVSDPESPHHRDYPEGIRFTEEITPLKYHVLKPTSDKKTEIWMTGNYTYLHANFVFVRRLSGSIVNVYIPSFLVVSLSWVSFWLDVAAVPARVTLGVTSLLTLGTQIVQARGQIPFVSYMTAQDVWLFTCLLMVFCSILEFAMAYNVHHAQGKEKTSASAVTSAFQRSINTEVHPEKKVKDVQERDSSKFGCGNMTMMNLQKDKALDRFSRKAFPSIFLLFTVVYWSYLFLYV